ncbi:MAG: ankyrin repeat domain-containing protein, partial [Candidatus Pacebacteria bacterium]|nr:ankyrin repeat domain-containing protein [Candidatus Paceibacterota bacterium]
NYDAVKTLLQKEKYDAHELGYALINTFFYGADSVAHDREKIANLLIDNGASIDISTSIGTPLMLAIKSQYQTVAFRLINLGVDVNAIKEREQTALMFACSLGNYELVKLLIQKGADVNAKARAHAQDFDGAVTPLKIAKEKKFDEIVKMLLQNGATE